MTTTLARDRPRTSAGVGRDGKVEVADGPLKRCIAERPADDPGRSLAINARRARATGSAAPSRSSRLTLLPAEPGLRSRR